MVRIDEVIEKYIGEELLTEGMKICVAVGIDSSNIYGQPAVFAAKNMADLKEKYKGWLSTQKSSARIETFTVEL